MDSARHRVALARLESLKMAGVEQFPRASAVPAPAAESPHSPVSASPLPEFHSPPEPDMPRPSKSAKAEPAALFEPTEPGVAAKGTDKVSSAATLEILQAEVAGCTLCHELATTRTQTVFGSGDPKARLCFMGEAPGADEDRTGLPFVGRAGQLLTKIIEACTLTRDEVYILNVLKCRPPGNRNPLPQESANCKQYLRRQLELIEPEYICCLGAVAAQNLLETTETIGKLRGQIHQYRGINVVCTYHPAYLLRNPAAKKDCWDDMKMLMGLMGVKV
jgi:uracil-DNA glycosylase family 4